MLVIDGKRVTSGDTNWWGILKEYDKIVTIKAAGRYRPRRFSNGQSAPVKLNIRIPMRFTIQDPTKGGVTVSVIYSPTDNIPIDANGMIDPKFQPERYKITALVNKIRKEDDPELLLALILHDRNTHSYLYNKMGKKPTTTPVFTIAPKGVAEKLSIDNDKLLVEALSFLIGTTRVTDKKLYDLYTFYGLDPDVLENEDIDGVIAALKEISKSDPAKFIADISDNMHDMKAKIKDAIDAGIFVVNADTRKVTWGVSVEGRDHKATILRPKADVDVVVAISEYLVNRDTNGDVRDTMLKQLELAEATV